MKDETWQALDKFYSENPVSLADEGVDYDEINAAERELGIPLPADYKEFIHRYGGGHVGAFAVRGLRCDSMMGGDNFIQHTQWYRKEGWPGTDKWAVFSNDHGGNPIGFDADGKVWIFDHDFGPGKPELYAPDFEGFVKKLLAKVRRR
jgi:hypothetical protein